MFGVSSLKMNKALGQFSTGKYNKFACTAKSNSHKIFNK